MRRILLVPDPVVGGAAISPPAETVAPKPPEGGDPLTVATTTAAETPPAPVKKVPTRAEMALLWHDAKTDDARREAVKAFPDLVHIYSEAKNFQ